MNTNNKYKLTNDNRSLDDGRKVFRIEALRDFGEVRKGDLGGFVESESNLSVGQSDNSWIDDDAIVSGSSKVLSDSFVRDESFVDNSLITRNSNVSGMSTIKNTTIGGSEIISSKVDASGFKDSKCHGSNVNDSMVFSGSTVENSECDGSNVYKSSVVGGSFISGSNLSHTDVSENSSVIDSKCKSFENNNGEVYRSEITAQSFIEYSELLGNVVIHSFIESSDLIKLDRVVGSKMKDDTIINTISSISLTDEDLSDLEGLSNNKSINR